MAPNGCVPPTLREVDDRLWQHADGDIYFAEEDVDPIPKRQKRRLILDSALTAF
jgi:hypothetical protein